MITLFKNLWNDESGQGMVEYALIVALISVIAVVAITGLGGKVKSAFEGANTKFVVTP
jgi:pilus assembly protein Flp/PilA